MSFYSGSVRKRESTGGGKEDPLDFVRVDTADLKGIYKFEGVSDN